MSVNKRNILELSFLEIEKIISLTRSEKFCAKQIWSWIYGAGIKSFSEMSNLPKNLRQELDQNYTIERLIISKDVVSFDETRKWLVELKDGNKVETVFIPEENRGTLCISSQVGCTLACKFCFTGTQLLVRNLEFNEIIGQILIAKDLLIDWNKKQKRITNIVFMGMGEPFFNYENVAKALKIMIDSDGLDFSLKKITISTSGLIPEILKCSKELKTNLAISLHATNNKVRTEIMAINKKYPIEDLMASCHKYNKENPQKKLTFEYVMLENINDNNENALELVKLIKKYNLEVKVNLIPFNSWQSCGYKASSKNRIISFQNILKRNKIFATIRKTRGDDVLAACGQLKSDSKRIFKNDSNLS